MANAWEDFKKWYHGIGYDELARQHQEDMKRAEQELDEFMEEKKEMRE